MTRRWLAAPSLRRSPLGMRLVMMGGMISILAICWVVRHNWGTETASAETRVQSPPGPAPVAPASPASRPSASPPVATSPSPPLKIVATVNGEQITREELGRECLRHYGPQVLESVVNKYLIAQECKRRNITVSQAEVNAEIERMATRFGLPVAQWLKLLKQERGIKAEQYATDIIWPTLALRKLAGERLAVSEAELREQYEAYYGPAVKARLIVCNDARKAQEVHALAVANPEDFGNLAKDKSDDLASASLKGLIQPIRKHLGRKEIEEVAFQMKEGEISQVIAVGNQYAILKCEGHLPPQKVPFDNIRGELEEILRDKKLRQVAQDLFRELQDRAVVVNVLNDPEKSRQMPGVAALINGYAIQIHELAEMCIERHGEEVLEGTIRRRLIEQACRKKNIVVSEADVDREIARAALLNLPARPDGSPDVEKWIQLVTQQQGVSEEIYRRDAVWPSVALKKLVGEKVEVTQEDLQKGYEANYGPRVRCRAIVLNNLRRAQQVWEMARSNLNEDYFGDLAEQYSVEASSRALRGEVPPIQKHGGQPLLEREAFALKPGELSGIIQTGPEQYVILYCLGQTKPVHVEFASVRDLLYEDIHEKKLRLAMAEYFEQLQQSATIDNFLAGTTQSPKKAGPTAAPAASPTRR